jgi:hypothetical protein
MQLISRSHRDWGWGVSWAFGYAVLYSAWVAFVSGGQLTRPIEAGGQTPLQIIATYFAIAAVVGPILGLFRPALSRRLGAFLIGSVVGFATYAGFGLAAGDADGTYLVIAAVVGVVGGGGLGVVFFDRERSKTS